MNTEDSDLSFLVEKKKKETFLTHVTHLPEQEEQKKTIF